MSSRGCRISTSGVVAVMASLICINYEVFSHEEMIKLDAGTYPEIEKKTGYSAPEGYNGFQKHKKKGKSRRY